MAKKDVKKGKVLHVLVKGEAFKGVSSRPGKNFGKPVTKEPPIVGYIIEGADGKKHVFNKLEAIEYVELQCDGELENAVIDIRTTKNGSISPYLRQAPGYPSLRELAIRIDEEVYENGDPVFITRADGTQVQKTRIKKEFAAKFGNIDLEKSGKKAGKDPAAEARKKAEKRAAVRAYLEAQKNKQKIK